MRCLFGFALLSIGGMLFCSPVLAVDQAEFDSFDKNFQREVRPLIALHCEKCHSAKVMEAEIDLSIFKSLADIRKHPETWQKVAEMLDSGQMPRFGMLSDVSQR